MTVSWGARWAQNLLQLKVVLLPPSLASTALALGFLVLGTVRRGTIASFSWREESDVNFYPLVLSELFDHPWELSGCSRGGTRRIQMFRTLCFSHWSATTEGMGWGAWDKLPLDILLSCVCRMVLRTCIRKKASINLCRALLKTNWYKPPSSSIREEKVHGHDAPYMVQGMLLYMGLDFSFLSSCSPGWPGTY